jgi:hypothetical protein
MTLRRFLLLATILALIGCSRSRDERPAVRINEVMANNDAFGFTDPNGLHLDWAEVYNPSDQSMSLGGFSLTDDPDRPRRYEFPPGLVVPARGFVVVFLAGNAFDEEPPEGEPAPVRSALHADFGLNADEDTLYLFAGDRLIDSAAIRGLPADVSNGRFPDGTGAYGTMYSPTPGAPNHPLGVKSARFTSGREPRPVVGLEENLPVPVRFTVVQDAVSDEPLVTLSYQVRSACGFDDTRLDACESALGTSGTVVDRLEPMEVRDAMEGEDCVPGPPPSSPSDAVDPDCRRNVRSGVVGPIAVRELDYEGFLPGLPRDTIVLWRVEVDEGLRPVSVCGCYKYGFVRPTLVISEYQPRNQRTRLFVCENCADPTEVRDPDWIEVHNYGEEPIDLAHFGLAGRDAEVGGNLFSWRFGADTAQDPFLTQIGPGEFRTVLADGDGGDTRGRYRRVLDDGNGNAVRDGSGRPMLHPEDSCTYYSTRFGLNLDRRTGFDSFVLVAPLDVPASPDDLPAGVVIDKAVLDFTRYAAENGLNLDDPNFLVDFAAGRFPAQDHPGAQTPDEMYPPNDLQPGRVTACPSPATCSGTGAENRLQCDVQPGFLPEVTVRPESLAPGAAAERCPAAGEAALVEFFAFVDALSGDDFDLELVYRFEASPQPVLSRGVGIAVERAPDARQGEASPGAVLYRAEARIPGQGEGLVVFSLRVRDQRLNREATYDEAGSPGTASFRYFSGTPPRSGVLINEVLPHNVAVQVPGLDPLSFPDYVELHCPSGESGPEGAPGPFVDLGGFYLTDADGPTVPLGFARRWAFPDDERSRIEPGGFLLLVFGEVPDGGLSVPAIQVEGFGLNDCVESLYLIGPDEAGNCIESRLSWNCGDTPRPDIAFGRPCFDPSRTEALALPSPGASNRSLPPLLHSVFHTDAEGVPNPCIDPGGGGVPIATVAAIVFLDLRLVNALGGVAAAAPVRDLIFSQGRPLSAARIVDEASAVEPPRGYVAARLFREVLLSGVEGVVGYRVEVEDACGGRLDPCGAGEFCFSLGTASLPRTPLRINEVNRSFPLPGGDGEPRPWIEIVNTGVVEIDLGGLSISASSSEPRQFVFPQGASIGPQGRVVFITDGGPPLSGEGAPAHLVGRFDWVPVVIERNPMGQIISVRCEGEVDLLLYDRVENGSCLIDRFPGTVSGLEFTSTSCSDGASLGRVPDGGDAVRELDSPSPGAPAEGIFVRGDTNGDRVINVSDSSAILSFLVDGSSPTGCLDALDADDNGTIDLFDSEYLLAYLFAGGAAPPLPFPSEGPDPSPDGLVCPP